MQYPLQLIDAPKPCLADGVVGRNAQALAALANLFNPAASGFSSLLLWGTPGSGKTFWLQAWAAQAGPRGGYLDCAPSRPAPSATEVQAPDAALAAAIEQAAVGPSVWLLDNVDRADPPTVRRLFQLYNCAREVGFRCVATASAPPLRLDLRDDLRTRLGQSLIFELQELNDEEKKNALRERAERLGLPLSEDLLHYLITRLPRDLGLLTRVLDALNDYALSRQRAATVPLLKELLDAMNANARPV